MNAENQFFYGDHTIIAEFEPVSYGFVRWGKGGFDEGEPPSGGGIESLRIVSRSGNRSREIHKPSGALERAAYKAFPLPY